MRLWTASRSSSATNMRSCAMAAILGLAHDAICQSGRVGPTVTRIAQYDAIIRRRCEFIEVQ